MKNKILSFFMFSFTFFVLLLSFSLVNASSIPAKTITVWTSLPIECASALANKYQEQKNIQINLKVYSEKDLLAEFGNLVSVKKTNIVLTTSANLKILAQKGYLNEYSSESTDLVSDSLKDENDLWVGIWYDPIVFCLNTDYLFSAHKYPMTWTEISTTPSKLGITDFVAADAYLNLFFSLYSSFDEETTNLILANLHSKTVQYSRYLSTPIRMTAMREVDFSIAVQSETIKYINQGYPLKIIFPYEGTSFLLTGVGIVSKISDETYVNDFVEWLLSDEAILTLQKNDFFYISTNPSILTSKFFTGKNIALFNDTISFSDEQKKSFLDNWLKNIRLK